MTNKTMLTQGSLVCSLAKSGHTLLKLCQDLTEKTIQQNPDLSPYDPARKENVELVQKTIQDIIVDITTPKDPIVARSEVEALTKNLKGWCKSMKNYFFQFNDNPDFKDNNLIKKYPHDAGWDIRINQDICLWPEESSRIKTGLHVVIPKGFRGIVKSRSGFAINHAIECSNAGVIDYGDTGEIIIRIYNNSKQKKFMAYTGDCIAQIIFDYSYTVPPTLLRDISIPQQIPELKPTEFFALEFDRGNNGIGSTKVA